MTEFFVYGKKISGINFNTFETIKTEMLTSIKQTCFRISFALLLFIVTTSLQGQSIYSTTSDSKIRSGPGIRYKSLGIIKAGEKLSLIEKSTSAWFKIEYKGKTGFLSAQLLAPVIESVKIQEPLPVERKTEKSSPGNAYIVIALVIFSLIFVVYSSKIKKEKNANYKKVNKTNAKVLPLNEKITTTPTQQNVKEKLTESSATITEKIKKSDQEAGQIITADYINSLISSIAKPDKDNADQKIKEPDKVNQNLEVEHMPDPLTVEKVKETVCVPEAILKIVAGIKDNQKENTEKKQLDQSIDNSTVDVKKDDSIIEVTNNIYYLKNEQTNLIKSATGVPFWGHQYIYSYSDISNASHEQVNFYNLFKKSFLQGEYLDLEGSTNYAFILLFELLLEYDHYKDIQRLKKSLDLLGNNYPKTKPYTESFYWKKYREGLSVSTGQPALQTSNYNDNDYWKLGSKYKTKLNLNYEEVKILNKLWFPNNNFCGIEFCCVEVLKLYLLTIATLKNNLLEQQMDLDKELELVADIILRKHFKYKLNSFNYKNGFELATNEIYATIYKYCENTVRDAYGHKRKINTDSYITAPEAKLEVETKVINRITTILPALVSKIARPDEATEIELYSQNTGRWKIKFEKLTDKHNGDTKRFIEDILSLGNLNKKNPSVEHIFFEASRFISKFDKGAALTLYVHYLFHDLKSTTFDNKQLTKTIQKNLFKTNEQLHDFGIVVSELINDKDLEKALQGVAKIYTPKRKKIQLDSAMIKEVQQLDSGTVQLLNEYLKDDYEDENNTIKTEQINNEQLTIEITQKGPENQQSLYPNHIGFTQLQIAALEIFSKSNFSVSENELESFAKSKGVFKNQLIDSINEICYPDLEDILIEEDEDYYIIDPDYYQRILAT